MRKGGKSEDLPVVAVQAFFKLLSGSMMGMISLQDNKHSQICSIHPVRPFGLVYTCLCYDENVPTNSCSFNTLPRSLLEGDMSMYSCKLLLESEFISLMVHNE